MAAQLPIRVSARKTPLDAASSGIAPLLPSGDFCDEGSLLGSTARQALALQDSDLDLGHVQPARMVGRVVELDPAQQCRGRLHSEHLLDAPLTARLDGDEDIAGAGALILVILLGRGADLRGQRRTSLTQQLLAFL